MTEKYYMRNLIVGLLCSTFVTVANAAEVAQTFTLDGRLFTSTASNAPPLLDSGTIKVQILSPDASCILYEESQAFNTSASDGYFSLQVGGDPADAKRTSSDVGNGMATVFSNTIITGIAGKQSANGTSACTYTPIAGEVRVVRVKVTPVSDGVTRTLAPDITMNSAPSALVAERAETLQGLGTSDFLVLGAGQLTQSNVSTVFSNTNYPRLTDLLSVGTGSYVRKAANGAASAPSVAGNAAAPSAGQFWYDSSANALKYYNGTTVKTVGTSSASDISGGTIGGSVAISTSGNIATTGNITASGNGTTTGVITGQTVTGNMVNANILRMADGQATPKYIEFKAPASIGASDLTYIWPAAFPNANKVLQSDSSGNLSWVSASSGTGDLKSDGSVALSADWDLNGATAGGTRLITGLADPSANDGAASKAYVDSAVSTAGGAFLKKDGSVAMTGNLKIGTNYISNDGDSEGLSISTSGDTTMSGSSSTAYVSSSAAVAVPNAAKFQINNTNGTTDSLAMLEFKNSGSYRGFIGTLKPGAGNTPVMVFGQQTGATAYDERMRIDASGNLLLGKTSSANGLLDVKGALAISGATSGAVKFNAPATVTSGSYTWPAATPASNMVLQSDNTGALSWVAQASGVGADSLDFSDFKDSMALDASTDISVTGTNVLSITNTGTGNSFVVNDAAADTTPFVIDANGKVGIGTSPTATTAALLTLANNASLTDTTAQVQGPSDGTGDAKIQLSTSGVGRLGVTGEANGWQIDAVGDSSPIYSAQKGYLIFRESTGNVTTNRLVLSRSGNLGIGAPQPNQLLTVEGPMSLRAQAAPSLTANYGKIYVDSGDSNKLKYMNPAGTITDLTAQGASTIAANSLDFDKMSDSLTLDASTDVSVTGANVFSITNSGTGNSFVVNDAAADTTPFVIDASGNIGVGKATPASQLDVAATTSSTSGNIYGFNNLLTITPSGASTASIYGVNNKALVPGSNTQSIQKVYGARSVAENDGSGTINTLIGADLSAYTDGGTVTNVTGALVTGMGDTGATAIGTLKGLDVLAEADGSLTTTTMYGIKVLTYKSGVGSVGTKYGIYLDDFGGATTANYGIYQASSSQQNYFAGNVTLDGSTSIKSSNESASSYTATGASYTIPDTSMNIRRLTVDSNTTVTLPSFTSPSGKMYSMTIFLKQDATGGRTVTFAGAGGDTIKWDSGAAPVISTTAGKISIIQLMKASDETVWYGSMSWRED